MPSLAHEALLLLFRNRPELAPELLRDALGVAVPSYAEARIESAELTDIVPTEYRADLVVLLVDDKPVLGIVVEAQLELRRDDRKRYSWPVYVASLRARLECPACLLVVTIDEATAERARETIVLGPGMAMTPLVLGPASVPLVVDVEQAKRDPELAVLSAIAHGGSRPEVASDLARAVFAACQLLDDERTVLYLDLVSASLGEIARIVLEGLMIGKDYEFQSAYFRNRLAEREAEAIARGEAQGIAEGKAKGLAEGKAEGLAEGKAEGLAEGKAEGLAEGKAEGLAEGKAEGLAKGVVAGEARSILKFLSARGIAVTAEQETRIVSCAEVAVLDRWLERAVHVATVDEIFDD